MSYTNPHPVGSAEWHTHLRNHIKSKTSGGGGNVTIANNSGSAVYLDGNVAGGKVSIISNGPVHATNSVARGGVFISSGSHVYVGDSYVEGPATFHGSSSAIAQNVASDKDICVTAGGNSRDEDLPPSYEEATKQ